jgi:SAM-dependent methyltransferase
MSEEDLKGRLAQLEVERDQLRERCAKLEDLIAYYDVRPIPPTSLRVRVGGWDDPDHFLGVGRKIYWDIKRLLRGVDRSLSDFSTILDFGCGCGRLTRYLVPSAAQNLVGVDIDPESIAWCNEHLVRERVAFAVNREIPPLSFKDGSLDLVIGISVFSHLPEDLQFAWLAELARIIRPGGILIASVHGETLLSKETAPETREKFAREGFLYAKGFGTPGLPDFYQTAYHRPDYVHATWQKGFRLIFEMPRGINNHQDAYIFERLDG